MNSSGIKRGLAVSAVAALGAVGIPAAANAASTAYSVTLTPATASAQAYQTVDFSGVAKDSSSHAIGGDTVSVKVSETTSSSVTTNPLNVNGTQGANTDVTTDDTAKTNTWTETVPVVTDTAAATLGDYKVTVGSSAAGTVNLTATDGGSANATLTVTGSGSNKADDVTGLSVTAGSTVTAYKSATAADSDPVAVTLKSTGAIVPLGSSGGLGGFYSIANASDPSTALATGYWGGAAGFSSDPYSKTVDLSSDFAGLASGSYVVTFWDNQDSNTNNTAGVDAGEPKATATVNIVDEPTWSLDAGADASSTTQYDAGIAYYGTATDFDGVNDDTNNVLPDDAAVTIPLSAQVVGDSATTRPAAGTKFWFDVTVGSKDTVRIAGTYDASTGLVTGSYAATKDDAATDGDVDVALAVSQSSTAGDGDVTSPVTVSSFEARDFGISQLPGAVPAVQATAGGAVSIPVQVVDQFGKAKVGDVLSYTVTNSSNVVTKSTTAPATDSTGRTTITYTDSPASAKGDTETVDATDSTTTGVDPLATVTVTYIAGTTSPAAITDGTAGSTTAAPVDPYKTLGTTVDTNGAYEANLDASATGNSADYSFVVVNSKGEPLSNQSVTLSAAGGEVTWGTKTGATVTATTGTDGSVSDVEIGSTKVGTVALTVTAGSASHSFAPVEVTNPGKAYSIVPVTTPQTITPGDSAKFVYEITDEWGNPVEGADVEFSLGSNTAPGTLDFATAFDGSESDKNGDVVAVLDTTSNDLGTGSITATPDGPTAAWASAKADDSTKPTATFTDDKGTSIAYTVQQPVVVTPPPSGGNTTPKAPGIKNVKASSKGNKDVIFATFSNAGGKRANLVRNGKTIAHGAVKNGRITFRVKDANGPKKSTRYVVKVAKASKAARTK